MAWTPEARIPPGTMILKKYLPGGLMVVKLRNPDNGQICYGLYAQDGRWLDKLLTLPEVLELEKRLEQELE
jgi:hypothetical protein